MTSERLITVTEVREIHRLAMAPVWEAPHTPTPPLPKHPADSGNITSTPSPAGCARPSGPTSQRSSPAGQTTPTPSSSRSPPLRWSVVARDLPLDLARIHNAFEKAHPFLDGIGRTGRLALNLILVSLGFPPAIIFKRDRDEYLDALDQADKVDPGRLAGQLARSVIDNLHRFVVPDIAAQLASCCCAHSKTGTSATKPCGKQRAADASKHTKAPTASGAPAATPSSNTKPPDTNAASAGGTCLAVRRHPSGPSHRQLATTS